MVKGAVVVWWTVYRIDRRACEFISIHILQSARREVLLVVGDMSFDLGILCLANCSLWFVDQSGLVKVRDPAKFLQDRERLAGGVPGAGLKLWFLGSYVVHPDERS